MGFSVSVFPVTPLRENCSLVVCTATNRAALIDPGGESEGLIAALAETGATLERILITHGHGDHIGAVKALKAHYGVPVEGPHQADAPLIERMAEQKVRLGLSEGEAFVPDRWLNHGDTVNVGEARLSVLHLPGHSPGHVAYVNEQAGWAFVGDVLFAGSVGRTDLPGGDHRTLIESITEKLLPMGDAVRFVPGHGPDSTLGRERRYNPYLQD